MARTPAKTLQPLVKLDKRGRPIFIEPLNMAILNGLLKAQTPAQVNALNVILLAYGVMDPVAAMQREMNTVSRFRNMTPADGRYQAERDRAVKSSGAATVGFMRSAGNKAQAIEAVEGNLNQTVMYVNEGPDPCEECLDLGGLEMPMKDFVAQNKMPTDRCLGGNHCYCQLVPVN
jgi:hypothetical protein